jgi:Ser/Thr protein kinase RdoA (MazF antagonist)
MIDIGSPLLEAVLSKFGVLTSRDGTVFRELAGGLCNRTYQVDIAQRPTYVLQQLNSSFPPNLTEDAYHIALHLKNKGWKVPLPTEVDGAYSVVVDGERYRLLPHIEGTPGDPQLLTRQQFYQTGRVLASFHRDLRDCTYSPLHSIPGFHDTLAILLELERVASPDDKLAHMILNEWKQLSDSRIPHDPGSIIHGDPRIPNFMFCDGQPFTLIDYDTFMKGSSYLDIGDFIRSQCCDKVQENVKIKWGTLDSFIKGYQSIDGSDPNLLNNSLSAARQIALELAARFVIDMYKDNYFGWDAARFPSRKEHNKKRAQAQLGIAVLIKKSWVGALSLKIYSIHRPKNRGVSAYLPSAPKS